MPAFDSEFLKKIEYLSLVSKRAFRGQLLARRRTKQLGGGVEFAEHRDYTAGDDFRYLDWNVYARHGHLLLKRFQEEQDLHVYMFVDCSRSMGSGTPVKLDYAIQVVAALAYIALDDLDRVSIIAFAEDVIDVFPLTRGKGRILTLLAFLEALRPVGSDTHLARTVANFIHRGHRAGLAIVVSDLFDRHGYERGLDLLRHRGYDPNIIQVFDVRDQSPDVRGDLDLIDHETNRVRKVTVNQAKLRRYRQRFDEFTEGVRDYGRAKGLSCTQTTTQVPFEELILQMMRMAGAVR
jgi:uncharacterized protein (DUF58 family)